MKWIIGVALALPVVLAGSPSLAVPQINTISSETVSTSPLRVKTTFTVQLVGYEPFGYQGMTVYNGSGPTVTFFDCQAPAPWNCGVFSYGSVTLVEFEPPQPYPWPWPGVMTFSITTDQTAPCVALDFGIRSCRRCRGRTTITSSMDASWSTPQPLSVRVLGGASRRSTAERCQLPVVHPTRQNLIAPAGSEPGSPDLTGASTTALFASYVATVVIAVRWLSWCGSSSRRSSRSCSVSNAFGCGEFRFRCPRAVEAARGRWTPRVVASVDLRKWANDATDQVR
jgi:hypothetical protein